MPKKLLLLVSILIVLSLTFTVVIARQINLTHEDIFKSYFQDKIEQTEFNKFSELSPIDKILLASQRNTETTQIQTQTENILAEDFNE